MDWKKLGSSTSGGLVELSVRPPRFALAAGDRPCASRLARLEARSGTRITSLRHSSIELEDAASRYLLGLLDGSRSRAELHDAMREFFAAAKAPPLESGEPRPSLAEFDRVLQAMAGQALLTV